MTAARQRARGDKVEALRWTGRWLEVLEQRDLPHRVRYLRCEDPRAVARCIREMSVRGAPAIGCAAAYGLVLTVPGRPLPRAVLVRRLERARELLAASRPTAVNLTWALERMARLWRGSFEVATLRGALAREAAAIFAEDLQSCLRIGASGAELLRRTLPGKSSLLTHCNTGALATAGHGTALGVIRSAHAGGRLRNVFVDETRPYLQGARLTAWELETERIPYQVITDSMAGHLMKTGEISAVIVGADRIAADGDTANKIGTYPLAVLARYHRIPFYVAAPFSTVDLATPSGAQIPIEERDPAEVTTLRGMVLTPRRARARHPAFDVTPAALITAIVTDRGVIRPPYRKNLTRASRRVESWRPGVTA